MAHKIVAVEVKAVGKRVVVSILGQSPRGSKFIIKSVDAGSSTASDEVFKGELTAAINELIPALIQVP